jgi:hypothetical protein
VKWNILPVPEERGDRQKMALRLNALGSLYFFEVGVLKRKRLGKLHRNICSKLETDNLKIVLELPRDHMKTTVVTEGLAIWWALTFNEADEAAMREIGYSDEWIRFMKHVHNPATRTLTISENEENAFKMGLRIDKHYFENDMFKYLFKELLPDGSCNWNKNTKQQKAGKFHAHGEGTFDYMGVGGAGQSRHYDRIIEDDLVGISAKQSPLVMEQTIDYHRLLAGLFDSEMYGRDRTGDEIIVGNRWTPFDLNGWIRENEPVFEIESHSAEGGCCDDHPAGEPIFPEEFSIPKLEEIRAREGAYNYSHHFLNLAVMEEECIFQKNWLKFYDYAKAKDGTQRAVLRPEVSNGDVLPDIYPSQLTVSMIVDPNHAGESGRARHSVVILGLNPDTDDFYLLDLWAKSASYDDLLSNIYRLAKHWKLYEFWLETIAAQRYLKYHIEYRNRVEDRTLRVKELRFDRSRNAKATRIQSLVPIFQSGKFWCRKEHSEFLSEYYAYPASRTVDVLDCIGYAPQTFEAVRLRDILSMAKERNDSMRARKRSIAGY